MPSSAPTVVTPLPPTPGRRMFQGRCSSGWRGSGRAMNSALRPTASGLRRLPPCTVTKLGQKPSTQLKSLLQEFWSISRLRPNSVSSGSTDRQLDLTLQSPQPSHTAGLMKARLAGSTSLPRLRRRRFSVAQVWS
ncbi:hypothetical protein D3C80_1536430 [compost metagenome]